MGDYYKVLPQEEGHVRLGSSEAVFVDVFIGTKKALVWDTGYAYGDLKAQVRELTDLPLIIVNSHGHVDHASGNYQFEEEVYIHEKDIELCKQHTSRQQRQGAVENAKHYVDYVNGTTGNILPEGFDEEAYLNGGTGKLVPIHEGKQFDLGGITLTVYEFPGHTTGSIGMVWEEEKILFVGDAMNPFCWLFLPESLTLADYKTALKKAYDMDITHYYMAHNPYKTEKAVLMDYMETAEKLDFEKGFPFDTPLAPGAGAKICTREGFGPQDMDKPGFAAIVISKEHL